MIRILPKILRDYPSATLVIVSPPNRYLLILQNLAAKLGVLSSTRIVSVTSTELNSLYSGADVVGFPSQAPENAPRVVLEGMRFGVPSVVWDNGWGAADIVKDGVGLRAKPYDINDFADKILATLDNEDMRIRMGKKAKAVAETYSWDRVGPIFEGIFHQAALS
jgi:glycosyltransferase involved in cell wall biosynthesis